MIRHFFTGQFLGFLAVGGTAALLNWLARIGFSHWLPFWLAVALAYAVGMLVAFLLNSFFVFNRSTRPRAQQARSFVTINLVCLFIVWAASIGLERMLRAQGMANHTEELAHAIAISLPMLVNFLLYKFHAFKE